MSNTKKRLLNCPICHRDLPPSDLIPAELIRPSIREEIEQQHLDWHDQPLCLRCVNRFRAEHVCKLLEQERGDLGELEEEVIRSLREQDSIATNTNLEFDKQLTWGERLSDRLSRFGGSWTFIVLFGTILSIWVVINSAALLTKPFDPYPFILLNLVLSCLAAIQAPIILMSQNRQESKDRLRGEHDYRVNLKAELEIRLLHTKLDQLLTHQWNRLLEIQQLQIDLMEDLAEHGISRKNRVRRSDA